MEFVSTAAGKVADFVLELSVRQLSYLVCYKKNVSDLNDCVQHLERAKQRVQNQINDAERNGKEIEADVTKWLKQVDEKITENETFQNDEGHAKTGCSWVLLPSLWFRHQLGRKAKKMTEDVGGLLRQTDKFDGVSYSLGPTWRDSAFSSTEYESFKSRNAIVDKVMKALKDPSVRMIGIYGLGGVGKTTLVKEVAKKVEKDKLFNVVVMANITRYPDIKKVQGQLADTLGLKFEEESEIGRAGRLRERLKKEQNILLVLDDLWTGLELNKLGISLDDDDFSQKKDGDMIKKEKSQDDYKGCKILLTSRIKEVLSNQMEVKEESIFSVEVLNEKEAETLFMKMAKLDKSSDLSSLAASIAKECAGLPMAIITVARALRNKNQSEWSDVLQQLRRQKFTGVQDSIEFSTKLSYDHLEDKELKSTFLLCAQMDHDSLTKNLLQYCVGLGILQGVYSIREARDKLNILIGRLKDSSLLLDSYSSDRFTMHDIVRDAALSIASKEQHVFTLRNDKLDEWPNKDELERYTTISLHYCDEIDEFPEVINCPRLRVFHVDSKDPHLKIPDNFFKGMEELRVLILTGIHLSSLPDSIKCLTNLRMLCLEQCILGDNLSIIGDLKKLRILSFSGSEIKSLPCGLSQLGKLQLFNISNCSQLRVIPPNLMSSLKSLEELYMRNNLIKREGEENQSQDAILAELRHLTQLTTLDICIPNVATWTRDLFLDRLEDYKIVIGDFKTFSVGEFRMPHMFEASRALALQVKEGSDIHYQNGIKMLFKRVQKIFLGELNGVRNFFYELNLEGFPCLEHLSIVNNSNIHYIINSEELLHPIDAFPNLKMLCLYQLKNLKKICCSQLTDVSFHKLKAIKIRTCAELKNLFQSFMVRLLTKLESIEVSKCDSLEEIVIGERQEPTDYGIREDKIEFPQLRSMILRSLPAFSGFYNKRRLERQLPNIDKEMTVDDEHNVTLFNEQVSIPNLENLELCSIKILKIWSDKYPSQSCKNLITLNVKDCYSLTYLLSLSMAKSLMNLKSLFLSGCEKMVEIFAPNMDGSKVRILPKLEEIQLTWMESLTTIWYDHVSPDSFSKLGSVTIEECKKLVRIFPHHTVGRFQSVDKLRIVNCESVEEIFDFKDVPKRDYGKETHLQQLYIESLVNLKHVWNRDPEGILDFKSLQNMYVAACPSLKNVFPVSIAENGLQNLEKIVIYNCNKMEEIVAKEEGSRTRKSTITFAFPRVKCLAFRQLPELTSFYPGCHKLEWPALKDLLVDGCFKLEAFATEATNEGEQQMFIAEKVISNLETMRIPLKEVAWLQQFSGNCRMHALKDLRLLSVSSMDLIHRLLRRIPNLEKLLLYRCVLKELVPPGGLSGNAKIGTVIQLKSLVLSDMPALQNIGFEHDPLLQRLERLILRGCPLLINFAPSSVSCFTHMTYLKVSECKGLINLMASSIAENLVQLTTMTVIQCQRMEEVVSNEGNEEEKQVQIILRKLTTLELVTLRNLTSFCNSKNHHFNFPSLERVVVKNCPKMKTFAMGVIIAPNLLQVHAEKGEDDEQGEEEDKRYWEGDLNATINRIFTDMVSLIFIENLKLSEHPELEKIWLGKYSPPDKSFGNLKIFVVENCEFLSEVIPSTLLSNLKNLEELEVRSCRFVEVIFDINNMKITETMLMAFHLKKLTLDELPKLKHIWNKNPQGILSFDSFQNVNVGDCNDLRTLFPASLAKALGKLETVKIRRCMALEGVVGKEEATAENGAEQFVFPHLISLTLDQLPELKWFYPGRFNLECPILNELRVYHCGKLKVFTSESRSFEEAHLGSHVGISTNAQPLFLVQKVIPDLEKLSVDKKDTLMLCNGDFPENLFAKLKVLELLCFHNVSDADILPYEFFRKVHNIEGLTIKCSNFKQIFPSQTLKDDHTTVFAQLRRLKLKRLSQLSSIGLEHSWVDPHCKDFEILHVRQCPRLTKLVQSAVSFYNLKELHIDRCHGLVYVFTSSTALSLKRLELLIIRNCKSLKEIVAKEGDEFILAEMTFEKLRDVHLIFLSGLESFHTGNSLLNFPCLELLYINECPRMKTFSPKVRAPMLGAIDLSVEDEDKRWEGDLQSTIDKEVVSFEYLEDLELSEYPELKPIWHGKIPVPNNCFRKLKKLVVEKCEFLLHVIPSYLMAYMQNLEDLQVRSCSSVQVIFDVNDCIAMAKCEGKSKRLKMLTLDKLPNLKHVWNENPQGIFNFENLQSVQVIDCEGLKTLFPIASVANDLVELRTLEIQNCGALQEIFGKEEVDTRDATDKYVFSWLTSLTLSLLPELQCFYPGTLNLDCSKLKVLNVYHCGKLEIFLSEFQSYQKALKEDKVDITIESQPLFSIQKLFPNLEELSLNEKETMMSWQGEFLDNFFPKLKCLQLHCFHNVAEADILPYGFLQKIPKVETLAVACSDFKDIFPSDSQRLDVESIKILSQLRGLRLEALSKLNSIGLEHSWLSQLRENLEILEVRGCPSLTKLVQSPVSFSNLKELLLYRCHGVVFLFTSSTAKSLEGLKKMSIQECVLIKEIVSKEEDEITKDGITFGQLRELSLKSLSSLASFFSGDSTLNFPYLEEVIIVECPRMKAFSEGTINAPLLPFVKPSSDAHDIYWEGNLNTTVQKLNEQKAESGTTRMQ